MKTHKIQDSFALALALSVCVGAAFAGDPATVLTIQESDGKTASAPSSIEIHSWSWGASNPGMAKGSGGGAGKVNVQDLSRSVVSPRDAASGLPTGKRTHKPISASVQTDTAAAAPTLGAPKIGEATQLVAEIQESETVANSPLVRACATGKHIAKATLTARGQTTELQNVVVSSCTVTNNLRRLELTGHVTVLK